MNVFDKHQLVIAKKTINMSDAIANVMGYPNKEQAKEIILKITGKPAKEYYNAV